MISFAEAIDTSTAGGRMFFLLGVFAQWSEEITERVNASVLTRAKLGKSINRSAPCNAHDLGTFTAFDLPNYLEPG